MNADDDDTVKAIKDLCADIVDMDDITRDKLKSSNLALDVKTKALAFRKANPPKSAAGRAAAEAIAAEPVVAISGAT